MRPEDIASDTHLLVPLYHGTSEIFMPSIRQHGLGAINPNAELRSRELLLELLDIDDGHQFLDPMYRAEAEAISQQRITAGGFNYRHGGTYFSPSQTSAVRYALMHRWGSELLSKALDGLAQLETYNAVRVTALSEKYAAISELRAHAHRPALIEVSAVPLRRLRSEDGEDPRPVVEQMADMPLLEAGRSDLVWQQTNFELLGHVPPSEVKCFSIRWLNDDSIFPEYSLCEV